ncbi:hypothetical protein [Chiayiivirga flava]|uniref:Uncharacterized protein n=1 Tax=Chiayiivirga flava TaxID=659595 RepID=A0A7W8D5U1_9GAMM|nr:hypothetical protein [Chiayiivirga flava]MBB5208469.1 hypothetical protein [Chiayiivirga flava]
MLHVAKMIERRLGNDRRLIPQLLGVSALALLVGLAMAALR